MILTVNNRKIKLNVDINIKISEIKIQYKNTIDCIK